MVGPAKGIYSVPTHERRLYVWADIESEHGLSEYTNGYHPV